MSYTNRLPSSTAIAHVARAIAFNNQTLYIGIGRTTPWDEFEDDEDFVPPQPDIEARNLDELIGMKRVTKQYLVYPDENGDIVYRNRTWSIAHTTEEALEHGARYVFLETTFEYDELPLAEYRQIGIFSNVVIHPGIISDAVVPTQTIDGVTTYGIDDIGILEVIDNRRVCTRASDSKETIQYCIEL